MPTKDKEKQAAYARKHYEQNKEAIKARAKAYTQIITIENREYVRTLKEETPCTDCGNFYPYYVMDFDHVNGDKLYNIGDMLIGGIPLTKIKEEIVKCEIVCSNCHRIRTHMRKEVT